MAGKCDECNKWYWSRRKHHKRCKSVKARIKLELRRS